MEYYKPPSFVPHKVIRTVDGHNIVLQDLDQDLEQHQVGVVANQVTEATMTYPRIAPNQGTGATTGSYGVAANQGIAATMTGNGGIGNDEGVHYMKEAWRVRGRAWRKISRRRHWRRGPAA